MLVSAMQPATTPIEGRSCGSCTLCCRLPEIDHFDKPANAWCSNCIEGQGCSIYESRPEVCRDFLCLWMTQENLGEEWDPSRSKMMVYRQGAQMTILVDPAYPDIWQHDPYMPQLKTWATELEQLGGYVIVFSHDSVFKVEGMTNEPSH